MYKVRTPDQKQYGPVTADVLRGWIGRGLLTDKTLVQQDGSAQWQAIGQCPELCSAFAGATPASEPLDKPRGARQNSAIDFVLPTSRPAEIPQEFYHPDNSQSEHRRCDYCARANSIAALNCRECGADLKPPEVQSVSPWPIGPLDWPTLPLVRVIPEYSTPPEVPFDDVIGLYENEVILFTKRRKYPIPPEAGEPGGHEFLKSVPSVDNKMIAQWPNIQQVLISKPLKRGAKIDGRNVHGFELRFHFTNGTVWPLFFPNREAENVIAALKTRIPNRIKEAVTPLPSIRISPTLYCSSFTIHAGILGSVLLVCLAAMLLGHRDADFRVACALLGIAVLLGAYIGVLLAVQLRAFYLTRVLETYDALPIPKSRRAEWWHKFLQPHRKILHTHLGSIVVKALGLVLFLLTLPFYGLLFAALGPFGLYLGRPLFIPATALIYLGFRLGLRPAEDIIDQDSRPPSIYLRSFVDDGKYDFNPKGNRLLIALPIRVLRLCLSLSADTAEEQVSQVFRKRGRFLAIGQPDELLPQPGPIRAYVPGEKWRDIVKEWMAKAQTIVLQPGETENVWWETEQALCTVDKQKVLFCLIKYRGDQHRYEQFAARFQQTASVRLPRYLGDRCFLWIKEQQAVLPPPKWRTPLGWQLSGCAVDLEKTLEPFFGQANRTAR